MIIKFEEIIGNDNDWLSSEILNSIPHEVIERCKDKREINVQLVLEGVQCEPKLLGDLLTKMEEHINRQAEYKMKERYEELVEEMQKIFQPLENATGEALRQIREKFNIKEEDY